MNRATFFYSYSFQCTIDFLRSQEGKKKRKRKKVLSITSIHLYPLNSSFFHKVKKKKFLLKPAIETRSSFVTDVSTSSSNFSPFHPYLQFETINKRSYEFKFFNVVDAFSISSSPYSSFFSSFLSSSSLRSFEQIILNSATEGMTSGD